MKSADDEVTVIGDKYYGVGYKVYKCKYEKDSIKFASYFGDLEFIVQSKDFEISQIEMKKTENCENNAKLYYASGNKRIYTYCLDKITLTSKNITIDLKNYLKTSNNAIEKIVNLLSLSEEDNNRMITIYRDNNNYSNLGLSIIKCNSKNLIDAYYIGDETLTVQDDFCVREHNIKTRRGF